jgi:hypothetical protein
MIKVLQAVGVFLLVLLWAVAALVLAPITYFFITVFPEESIVSEYAERTCDAVLATGNWLERQWKQVGSNL